MAPQRPAKREPGVNITHRISALSASLTVFLSIVPAQAQEVFHRDLVEALESLDSARGPDTYTALRRVWSTWNSADPNQVEEALLAVERDRARPAPTRAYAGMLAAYARLRRGDVVAARRKLKELAFVDQWQVLGPFDNEGKGGLDTDFGPEKEFAIPPVPGRAYSGKERPVRWRPAPADRFVFGWLDLGSMLRPEEKICAYARTTIRAKGNPHQPRPLTLWVGNSGAFKLWFDGRPVGEDKAYRGYDAERFAARVELGAGSHDLTLKVCGEDQAPILSLRLGDADGAPELNVEFPSSPEALAQAAQTAGARMQAKATKEPVLFGPLRELERGVAGAKPSAAALTSLAEYLVATGSDDPTEHRARDLARRAAELAPTLDRLLLAGELAEDRNQTREWLVKANALVHGSVHPTAREQVELALAQAALARGSVNWRDAFPFYEQVLKADPTRVEAIQGEVELYNEAGLPRTALKVLEHAVARNPASVNLLNMHASQLRVLGRGAEASAVEARYAGLRFDDRSYLEARLNLAVARRERETAERWIGRLRQVAPDSQWAYRVAARAYRGLGQSDRAVTELRHALDLAPEDTTTLHSLADLQGELGLRDEQLTLLRKVLELSPQNRAVREYLEHVRPPKAQPDESYAWAPERFIGLRSEPAAGENQRILRDLTVTTVYPNGKSSKFQQLVFQPLTDAAAAGLRQYAFQYQADREVVRLRGARVFRKDGRVDEAVESGEGAADSPDISMYTSARTFYIQLPRLEAGDVVELKYRVDDITPRNEFADYFGELDYLQRTDPSANAEYVLITPKSRAIRVESNLAGLDHTVKETGDNRIHRFFAGRVPAVIPEPAMPPMPEVAGFVHASTYESYAQMGKWYWGLVREQFDLDDETRKLVHEVVKDAKTEREKVALIFNWVVKNTRYVALEFGIYGYKPHRAVQTVARGWGDCKDKATVLVSLLRELGIPSTIVVVRTQHRGELRSNLASLAPFDHAIAYVPSLDLYLDGTAEYSGATELPAMDLGALALQIDNGNSKLVHLPEHDPNKNVTHREVRANLQSDGSAKLEIDYQVEGSPAPEWRVRFHAKSTQKDRLQSVLLGPVFPGFAIADGPTGIQTNDLENYTEPVHIKVKGTSSSLGRKEGATLSLAVTSGTRLTPVYASLAKRRYDTRILMFPTIDDTFVVKIPAGMHVVSSPTAVNHTGPFGAYSVEVAQRPGEVLVKSRVAIRTSRVVPADYAAWQRFCAEVDAALTPRLVVGP